MSKLQGRMRHDMAWQAHVALMLRLLRMQQCTFKLGCLRVDWFDESTAHYRLLYLSCVSMFQCLLIIIKFRITHSSSLMNLQVEESWNLLDSSDD